MEPSTFVRQVVAGSCVGWNAQARWTTASASAKWLVRSLCSEARSTAAHSVFAGDQSGIRRASPSTVPTSGSSERSRTTLVPTLPVAPVITILLPVALLTLCSSRPAARAESTGYPQPGKGTQEKPRPRRGNHDRGGTR